MRLLRISVIAAAVVSLALAVLGCGSEAPETAAVPATATALPIYNAVSDLHARAYRDTSSDRDAVGNTDAGSHANPCPY